MKVELKPTPAIDEETTRESTGRALSEWMTLLDAEVGPQANRQEVGRCLFAVHKVNERWCSNLLWAYEMHRGLLEKDGRPRGFSLCSTKTIKAPASIVGAAFVQKSELDAWYGAAHTSDAVEGARVSNADGNAWTVHRVRDAKGVRWNWEGIGGEMSEVDVMLKEASGKTSITLNHTRIQARDEADALREAWSDSLNRLKAYIEH